MTDLSSLKSGMPKPSSPPMRLLFSNTGHRGRRGRAAGGSRPAGPEPTMATFLPVLTAAGCGLTQPFSQALSMIACSIDLMPTGVGVDVQRAGGLARRRTDAAGEVREVVGRVRDLDRFLPVATVNQIIPVGNDVVHRTAVVAERDAAVHAARALFARFFVGQGDDEFLVVLETLLDRA